MSVLTVLAHVTLSDLSLAGVIYLLGAITGIIAVRRPSTDAR